MRTVGWGLSVGRSGWASVDIGADAGQVAVSLRQAPRRAGSAVQVLRLAQAQAAADAAPQEIGADLARRVGAQGERLMLTLARGDYRLMVVPEPAVAPDEMPQALRWTLASQLEMPPEEADLGWMAIPGIAADATRTAQLYVAAAAQSLVNQHRAAMAKRAGLALRTVGIREAALRNIAGLYEREGEGLALMAVGERGVSLVFCEGGELVLDRYIEQPLAEWREADAEARTAIHERVALPVLRSVDHIGRSRAYRPVGRLLLAPMAEELGLFDYLAAQLPMQVERLDLAAHFDFERVPELRDPGTQARCLVALGAALRDVAPQGLAGRPGSASMNLLMRPRQPVSMALWGLGLMAVLALALGGYAWQLRSGVQDMRAQLAQGAQQVAQVKAEIETIRQREGSDAEVDALNRQVAALKPRAEGVRSLVDSLRTASLGRPEGYSDYLERLARISDPELWVTGVEVLDGGRRVKVAGRALNHEAVVRYARRLNESFESLGVTFNAVQMAPADTGSGKSGINFTLS
ncbi:hypothetical protein [Pelomonas sp. KK5]|uniref:hypothetical protein n=1 Tax=Pelomonas sp. KK5 TaxID=1855730 RepID=UPI00117D92CD|nr:hypothetical protein [Pelomonas sp. KK5]